MTGTRQPPRRVLHEFRVTADGIDFRCAAGTVEELAGVIRRRFMGSVPGDFDVLIPLGADFRMRGHGRVESAERALLLTFRVQDVGYVREGVR